jgi:phosphopantothenoylcysteine decarboxylase/phosphopantothenate--cysteine ligase
VRYLGNRSSGKQGHAIAASLAARGADTVLISGPTALPDPPGVRTVHVETAHEMLEACRRELPVDVAICAAAVADWRVIGGSSEKKRKADGRPGPLELAENPDILATIAAAGDQRPSLVVGFAAETSAVLERATAKRGHKGCDWIIANDVSEGSGTFGGDDNTVHLIRDEGTESWARMSKSSVADRLAAEVAAFLESRS